MRVDHDLSSRLRLTTATLAVLDCFLLLGLLGIYLKIGMLDQQWDAIARFLGELKAYQVTPLQRLGFYFDDIIVNLLVMPPLATLLACGVFRRFRAGGAALTCGALAVLFFFELRAQTETGQYVSRDLLMDSLRWSIANSHMIGNYVNVASIIKLLAVLALFAAIWVLADTARRSERGQRPGIAARCRRPLALTAIAIPAIALATVPVSFAWRRADSALNASSIGRVARVLLMHGGDSIGSSDLNLEEVLAASRTLTRTPALDRSNPLVGSERGDDVLVFIMETGPAQALDFSVSGRDLPGMGALFDHAFVARQHYTSYPYTSDAVYSILSGLYPQGRRRLFRALQNDSINGLMSALRDSTPVRGVYLPSLYHAEVDDRMYAMFGAQTLYEADAHTDDRLRAVGQRRADELLDALEQGNRFDADTRAHLHARLVSDLQALEKMKADITDAVHAGRRYCVAYLPQVAHGPWMALHRESSVLARGHALMLLEDLWVKELVDLLRDLGRLDHTLVAITADHGIRTRAEDPALAIGRISDYMFRVPLLIHAPNAVASTTMIDVPSSHIDIAPTLLALLGETGSAEHMQGIPLWQRKVQDRLYFWAGAYGGADGFAQDGAYYMQQSLSNNVFVNHDALAFDDGTLVRPDDPAAAFTRKALDEANQLQVVLVTRLIQQASR